MAWGAIRVRLWCLRQAIIPSMVSDAERTRTYAWYNVLQDIGHALGGLLAVIPTLLRQFSGAGELASFQSAVMVYCAAAVRHCSAYLRLSPKAEVEVKLPRLTLSPQSRKVLWRILCTVCNRQRSGAGLSHCAVVLFLL